MVKIKMFKESEEGVEPLMCEPESQYSALSLSQNFYFRLYQDVHLGVR